VLCHQRIFPKKELFHDNGIFDVRYKVYADYDWLLRNYRRGANIKFFDRFVTYYDCQGASFRSRRAAMLEKARIICRNFAFFDFLFYLVYATLRSIKRGSI